ncbi:MAG: MTH1187 family thiamine-binding protein [Desulfobacterales bacterium]
MSVIIELSIFPTDKGASVSPYVARALAIIHESGLPYVLTPMATCIEGEWPAVMAVVDECFKNLASDCDRVYLTLKADYRKARTAGLQQKIAAVEKRLGRD